MQRIVNDSAKTIRYEDLTPDQYAQAIVAARETGVAVEWGPLPTPYVQLGPDGLTTKIDEDFQVAVFNVG